MWKRRCVASAPQFPPPPLVINDEVSGSVTIGGFTIADFGIFLQRCTLGLATAFSINPEQITVTVVDGGGRRRLLQMTSSVVVDYVIGVGDREAADSLLIAIKNLPQVRRCRLNR